ncbi:MAG: hypothetical protein GY906_05385 [bacterium]|nr:hypothetical protein [bacterium]
MKLRSLILTLVSICILAAPATAQFTQYTAPGELPLPELPTKERWDQAMEQARWRTGPFRIQPWLTLYKTGWDNNVLGEEGETITDFTATLGLGLRAYTRLGPKVVVAAHALPEYVWWAELEDRRVWNGRYGLGLYGYFNHLNFEVTANSNRKATYLNSQLEQPVNVRNDRLGAAVELRVGGHLGVFAEASDNGVRYREDDIRGPAGAQLLTLDRDEQRIRGGLRYHANKDISIGLGVERIEIDFIRPEHDRSSSGDGPVLDLRINREHFAVNAQVTYPDLEPSSTDSRFVPYNDFLGRFQISWKPKAKYEWQLYGRSDLAYSYFEDYPYFNDKRLGLAVVAPVATSVKLRPFVETGVNEYPEAGPFAPRLSLDVRSFGIGAEWIVDPKLKLTFTLSRTDYEGLPGYADRSINRVHFGFILGQNSSNGAWY